MLIFYCHSKVPNKTHIDKLMSLPGVRVHELFHYDEPKTALLQHSVNVEHSLLNHDGSAMFIGVDTGAWVASNLARWFELHAILINPDFNFGQQRLIPRLSMDRFFFSDKNQSDIQYLMQRGYGVTSIPGSSPTFEGDDFNAVLGFLRGLLN